MTRGPAAGPVLLVTGFGAFAHYAENPSGAIAAAVDGASVYGTRVVGRVLEVSWREAWPAVLSAVDELAPAGLLLLGVCPDPFFRLELMAKNLAAPLADARGGAPARGPVVADRRRRPGRVLDRAAGGLAGRADGGAAGAAGGRRPGRAYAAARLWPDAGTYLCNTCSSGRCTTSAGGSCTAGSFTSRPGRSRAPGRRPATR
jgi:hypothetical protein